MRQRAGEDQRVSVARGGDKVDAPAGQIVKGIVESLERQFAAIAGAAVEMTKEDRADGAWLGAFFSQFGWPRHSPQQGPLHPLHRLAKERWLVFAEFHGHIRDRVPRRRD